MYSGVAFAIIGVALWLGANYLSGYGTAVLSQAALFIGRKTWLVIRARRSKSRGIQPPTNLTDGATEQETRSQRVQSV